jgi:hypothetical protein
MVSAYVVLFILSPTLADYIHQYAMLPLRWAIKRSRSKSASMPSPTIITAEWFVSTFWVVDDDTSLFFYFTPSSHPAVTTSASTSAWQCDSATVRQRPYQLSERGVPIVCISAFQYAFQGEEKPSPLQEESRILSLCCKNNRAVRHWAAPGAQKAQAL